MFCYICINNLVHRDNHGSKSITLWSIPVAVIPNSNFMVTGIVRSKVVIYRRPLGRVISQSGTCFGLPNKL